MTSSNPRDVRFLRWYGITTTTALLALGIMAFRQSRSPRFDEITVERINVVEKDGTLRLTISNHGRLPDPVLGGKSYPLRTGTDGGSGLIFFNEEGNEDGGLVYQGRKTATGYRASGGLTFDQYNQDETIALDYTDENRQRRAGLLISDRPDTTLQIFAESAMAFTRITDSAEKARRMAAFRAAMRWKGMYGGTARAFIGKNPDKSADVSLFDRDGHPRLRMRVDSTGAPTLEFLDASGKVVMELPGCGVRGGGCGTKPGGH
jgi:hypothetical protein